MCQYRRRFNVFISTSFISVTLTKAIMTSDESSHSELNCWYYSWQHHVHAVSTIAMIYERAYQTNQPVKDHEN